MNPINQSLSSLLRNPAFQPEAAPRRSAEQSSGDTPVAGESLKVSDSARQALARANAEAALPAVRDLSEAQDLTRMLRDALSGGGASLAQSHRSLDPQTVGSLLR